MGRRKKINKEQKPWYQWKNLKPKYELLQKIIQTIPNNNLYIKIDDYIIIGKSNQLTQTQSDLICQTAKSLMPWRKGPFELFGLDIDTEWKSYIKYNLIEKHFDITDKVKLNEVKIHAHVIYAQCTKFNAHIYIRLKRFQNNSTK